MIHVQVLPVDRHTISEYVVRYSYNIKDDKEFFEIIDATGARHLLNKAHILKITITTK